MAREESSVVASLQQLAVDEERRCTEQAMLAHRRRVEQERQTFEQEARRAEAAQRRAEAAVRESSERARQERAEREAQETQRAAALESARADAELRAKVAVIKLEQEHVLERLAVARDQRLAKLEGQRIVGLSLFATLALGTMLVYAVVERPAVLRLEQTVSQLQRANQAQLGEHEREKSRLIARIAGLEDELAAAQKRLDQNRQPALASEPKPPRPHPTRPQPKPPVEVCVDEHDPLCGKLK